MRFSRGQRTVVYVVLATLALSLVIGLWPVSADVFGNPSYSCGSGFLHSAHTWNVDSVTSIDERNGDNTATGTPRQVCPDKVYNRRDWALLLGAFALVIGILALALMQRPQDRTTSAIFASMRIRDADRR